MENIVPLTLLFLVLLIIPSIITFIYLKFYNHSINKSLTAPRKHKLLRPIWVLIISFILEVVIVFSLSYHFTIRDYEKITDSTIVSEDDILYIHTASEVEDSIYDKFNGQDVAGYDLTSYNEDQYSYSIYHNNDTVDSISPYYIIYIQYNGDFNSYSLAAETDWNERITRSGDDSKEYYIIFNDESDLEINLINSQDELSFNLEDKI